MPACTAMRNTGGPTPDVCVFPCLRCTPNGRISPPVLTRLGPPACLTSMHPLATREPVAEFRLLGRVPFEAFLALQSRLVYEAGGSGRAEDCRAAVRASGLDHRRPGRLAGAHPVHQRPAQARATGHPLDQPGRRLRAARSRPVGRLSDRAAEAARAGPWASTCGDCSGGLSTVLPN